MTPDERREVVAMLRGDAAYEFERANGYANHDRPTTAWMRERAWHLAARANLLNLAADEIERAKETDDDR